MEIERVKQTLQMMAKQAEAQEKPLDHILLYSEHDFTQEIFAYFSKELRRPTRFVSAPTMKLLGDLAAVLTHLKQGDILIIDEVQHLSKEILSVLYVAMTDHALDIVIGRGLAAKNVRLPLPLFTVVAITTQVSHVQRELLWCFSVQFRLDPQTLH